MGTKHALQGDNAQIALQMLESVCRLLDEKSVPYLLEAGTLLGIVRENRLLPWDTDLDITIGSNHLSSVLSLRRRFWALGYRIRTRRFRKDTGPFRKGQVRIIKIQTRRFWFLKDKNIMDIFIKYKNDEGYYEWVIDDQQPVLKKAPAHFYENLGRFHFNNYAYSVPKESEKYLIYHYGSGWRIPVKTWDFRLDDFCDKIIL